MAGAARAPRGDHPRRADHGGRPPAPRTCGWWRARPSIRERFRCADLRRTPPAGPTPAAEWRPWRSVAELPGGKVHLSALPVGRQAGAPRLRGARPRHELHGAPRGDAAAVPALAFARAGRSAPPWSPWWPRGCPGASWSNEIRRLLRGRRGTRPEFQPVLRDVRELVERLVRGARDRRRGRAGTPQRLKQALGAAPAGRAGGDRRQPRAVHPRARPRRAASACSTRPAAWSPRSSR